MNKMARRKYHQVFREIEAAIQNSTISEPAFQAKVHEGLGMFTSLPQPVFQAKVNEGLGMFTSGQLQGMYGFARRLKQARGGGQSWAEEQQLADAILFHAKQHEAGHKSPAWVKTDDGPLVLPSEAACQQQWQRYMQSLAQEGEPTPAYIAVRGVQALGASILHEPDTVAAELIAAEFTLSSREQQQGSKPVQLGDIEGIVLVAAECLLRGPYTFWRKEMWGIAVESTKDHSLFRNVTPSYNEWQGICGCWCWERPSYLEGTGSEEIALPKEPGLQIQVATVWLLIATEPTDVASAHDHKHILGPGGDELTVTPEVDQWVVCEVRVFMPGEYRDGRIAPQSGGPLLRLTALRTIGTAWGDFSSVAAMNAFLKTKIVDVEPSLPLPRAERRRAWPIPPPPLRVIKLRERRHLPTGHTPESRSVDWQYRWPVTGHFRRKPGDLEGVREPSWVDPHIKGPEDKPFRPHQITVRTVVR